MLSHLVVCLASLVASSTGLSLPVHSAREELNGRTLVSPAKLIAFGDSFSDNGTGAWTVTNHTWPADPAYDGHRFSNGPVWVEDLANILGVDLDDSAIGGATSNNSATQGQTGPPSALINVPSALNQVAAFLEKGETIGPDDLVVILIGANDALFGGTVDPVIAALSDIIRQLNEIGATKFLLASYPDLGDLPLKAFATSAATDRLEMFSQRLETSLKQLWHDLCTHLEVGFVDGNKLFRDMMLHPTEYGFDPDTIHKSCLVGVYGEAPHSLCSDPDRYIFWDEYHVTRASHLYLAKTAFDATLSMCDGQIYP